MDIKHIWSIPCQKANIDMRSGLLTLVDVLEEITVTVDPKKNTKDLLEEMKGNKQGKSILVQNNFSLVSFWEIPENEKNKKQSMKIKMFNSDNLQVGEGGLDFTTDSKSNFHKTIFEIPSIPVNKSGTYYLSISLKIKDDFVELSRIPFNVKVKILDEGLIKFKN